MANPSKLIMLLLQLKHVKPTIKWIERLLDGVGLISEAAVLESEFILDDYIYCLLRDRTLSPDQIIECMDKAISAFNKIGGRPNSKYGSFIETIEREEILSFLTDAARIAGLSSELHIDEVTNVVREW